MVSRALVFNTSVFSIIASGCSFRADGEAHDPKARSSVVEHYLDTVGVGSSILPAPTTSARSRGARSRGARSRGARSRGACSRGACSRGACSRGACSRDACSRGELAGCIELVASTLATGKSCGPAGAPLHRCKFAAAMSPREHISPQKLPPMLTAAGREKRTSAEPFPALGSMYRVSYWNGSQEPLRVMRHVPVSSELVRPLFARFVAQRAVS